MNNNIKNLFWGLVILSAVINCSYCLIGSAQAEKIKLTNDTTIRCWAPGAGLTISEKRATLVKIKDNNIQFITEGGDTFFTLTNNSCIIRKSFEGE